MERMLKHDEWTTARLLRCSIELSNERLDQRFDFGHGSVRATFIHMIDNMRVWCDLMANEKSTSPRLALDSSIAGLREHHDSVSEKIYRLGRNIADAGRLDDTFVDTLDSPPRGKSFGGAILHLATHSMHHRAQLLFMLNRLGVNDLPEGDALSWENQHLGGWDLA